MAINMIKDKIEKVKDILCGMFDERSLFISIEELYSDGGIEETLNKLLDDIQKICIEMDEKS